VIFESLAFLVAVPIHKETVWPVNCEDSHEHHARDTEGRNARQEPDREAERTKELSGNRSSTNTAGIPESMKDFMVPLKPWPPNQPSTF